MPSHATTLYSSVSVRHLRDTRRRPCHPWVLSRFFLVFGFVLVGFTAD